MASDETPSVREAALDALDQWLREIQAPHQVKALAGGLFSTGADVRRATFTGLEKLLASLVTRELLSYELSEPGHEPIRFCVIYPFPTTSW